MQIQEFQTICGAHKTVKTCAVSEVIEQVTCGNCLRKYTVFKWNPDTPKRGKSSAFIPEEDVN